MENPIQPHQSLNDELRRIFSDLLEETRSIAHPPHQSIHESVHQARKNFKFARAAVRLIKYPLGEEAYSVENIAYRDMGRLVSDLRDARVLLDLVKSITNSECLSGEVNVDKIVKLLENQERRILDKAIRKERRFEKIVMELSAAKERVLTWPAFSNSISILLTGLKDVYGKGRSALETVNNAPSKEKFHEWRKQVKYFWHQFEMMENFWPGELQITEENLHQLSDLLGEEHDLANLSGLLGEKKFREKIKGYTLLTNYITDKRERIQNDAVALGSTIYSREPDQFIKAFESDMPKHSKST